MHPDLGDFVRVRDSRWLVEAIGELGDGLQTLTLAGIDEDALGEQTDIVWTAEIDAEVLKQDDWVADACGLIGLRRGQVYFGLL